MAKDDEAYDLQRLEMLMRGEAPEGLQEELFVRAYAGMLSGEKQINILSDIALCIHEMSVSDWHYYNLGLAIGERDYQTAQEELEDNINQITNKTTH